MVSRDSSQLVNRESSLCVLLWAASDSFRMRMQVKRWQSGKASEKREGWFPCLSTTLMSRGVLCSLPASVPCAVAPEKPVCRPQPPQVRRTFSLDTILSSYLLGQWPRDADGAFACCTNDKATQVMRSPNWKRIRMGAGDG